MKPIFILSFFALAFLPFSTSALTIDEGTFERGYTLTSEDHILAIHPQTHETTVVETSRDGSIVTVSLDPKGSIEGTLIMDVTNIAGRSLFYRAKSSADWEEVISDVVNGKVHLEGSIKNGQYGWKDYVEVTGKTQRISVNLDAPTVKKGYTIELPGLLKMGIVPDSVQENVTVRLKSDSIETTYPEGLELISPIMSYDVYHPDVAEVTKPILLSMDFQSDSEKEKALYYYDRNQQRWNLVPTTIDYERDEAHAVIWFPFAHIAVFEKPTVSQVGMGSWYGASHIGLASNDYPYGTLLRVTSLRDGRSVVAPVVSTGPFVPGRIVDLTKPAFEQIGDPYHDGVLKVKVEQVF